MKKILVCLCVIAIAACAGYTTPPRDQWSVQLRGASYSNMDETAKVAKRPVLLGAGGKTITATSAGGYGAEPASTDINPAIFNYMAALEAELYDSLLKPGIQVQRVGTDVVLLLTRNGFMYDDAPEISTNGVDTLKIVAKILQKYNATYVEIAGYTDAMKDQNAAVALSLDMAQRVAIFLARNEVLTTRMFIVGRGSARPIAAQDDIGRLMNRRVELRISPAK